MSRPHVVSTFGEDGDPHADDVAEAALASVDPDNILLGTSFDLDAPHHRSDYFAVADTNDLHAALRHQDERYRVTPLED